MKNSSFLLLIVALLMSGCSVFNYKDGPELIDLSGIPAPRTGGPDLAVSFSDAGLSTFLNNSGYFSSVKQGVAASDVYVEVKYGSVLYGTWGCLPSLWTLGLIPCKQPKEEIYTVLIKDKNKQMLWRGQYVFEGSNVSSLWPHVYFFGKSEKKVHGVHYARITSNVINNLNKIGLLSE